MGRVGRWRGVGSQAELVIGSEEYWHSGGGIWLVFSTRPDGRFAVIGSESGGIYASREEFEADEYGEKAENQSSFDRVARWIGCRPEEVIGIIEQRRS